MAKKNPLGNVFSVLIVIIVVVVISTIGFTLYSIGIINVGLTETPEQVLPLAQIPIVTEPAPIIAEETPEEDFGVPDGHVNTEEDIITAFLDSIGVRVTETFGVDASIKLVDANLEEQFDSAFLNVQPLDPRKVITTPIEELSPLRVFHYTDFKTQLNDAGTKYHQFSGWNIVNEPSQCINTGDGFPYNCPIAVTITTSKICTGVPNTGLCAQVVGYKNKNDDTSNGSQFHGLSKGINVADWTREGDLILSFDYSCNQATVFGTKHLVTVKGEFTKTVEIPCMYDQKYSLKINDVMGDSNTLTVQIGTQATNVDHYSMNLIFNNIKVVGNSVIKREAIETFQSLSLVQNDEEARLLDLGFIEVGLVGKTIFDNEKVIADGKLETRIDGKTISTHVVSGSGITTGKMIPLRIDGQDKFIFKLDKQFYTAEKFHKFDLILNDFIVTVGEGEKSRTFEYHTPFVAYTVEFNVLPDEIVAFGVKDRAISVLKSDTTFKTCGLSSGEDPVIQPEVLPPVVNIIQNGFTIATTNPNAGKILITNSITKEVSKNTEFCSVIPNIPRDSTLTFKIGNQFLEKQVPSIQQNYFVKCIRAGCSSNIGFVSASG